MNYPKPDTLAPNSPNVLAPDYMTVPEYRNHHIKPGPADGSALLVGLIIGAVALGGLAYFLSKRSGTPTETKRKKRK